MKPRSRTRLFVLTAALAALLAAPAPAEAAREVSGVEFAERVGAGQTTLRLCGAGLLRWNYILKVYVAALYRDDCDSRAGILEDVPKRLEISYLRGFGAEQFGDAAEKILERTYSEERLAPLRERIERMANAYRSVEEGDRYALTYRPGVGTELALNGDSLVTVRGADFASVYFAIWLGPDPVDEGLREDLLSQD